jgi:plasmid stabilization system protein ParE
VNESYILTPTAQRDLESIWQYLVEDADEETADEVFNRIHDQCARLSLAPDVGHFRRDLLDERFRFMSIWSYLIVYRAQTRPLRIVAILHGRRDLKSIFKRRRF